MGIKEKRWHGEKAKDTETKWPLPAGSENPHVVIVVSDPSAEESLEALTLLKEADINYEVEVKVRKISNDEGPLPWLLSASNGAFSGLNQINWYVRTFQGSPLAY